MSRRKDPHALSERTKAQYAKTLARAYGRRVPGFVPQYETWPESTRAILRAALQAYWAERGQRAKGLTLAEQIHSTARVERAAIFPSLEEAAAFWRTGSRVAPVAYWAVTRFIGRHGLRSEEGLAMPRAKVESAARFGRLVVLGKNNVERVLHVPQSKRLLDELLTATTRDGDRWDVVGALLSPSGTLDTRRLVLTEYVRLVAETAGLDPSIWHPHVLRHVFSDQMLADGTSERELQAALGHKRLETLARYTHPKPERFSRNIKSD